MTAAGYLFLGVFLIGPLLGAIAASARGRTHPGWLAPLWGAVIGAGVLVLALVAGRFNLPQQDRLGMAVMALGVAAWVVLVPALAFPVRSRSTRPPREQEPAEPG